MLNATGCNDSTTRFSTVKRNFVAFMHLPARGTT